jgi:hypothetical protein
MYAVSSLVRSLAALAAVAFSAVAFAAGHAFTIDQVYSNADGAVQ